MIFKARNDELMMKTADISVEVLNEKKISAINSGDI